MKRKANIQKQAMIEALKPRYYVLEWDGGYNLYDTTKPAKQTQVGGIVMEDIVYIDQHYDKNWTTTIKCAKPVRKIEITFGDKEGRVANVKVEMKEERK